MIQTQYKNSQSTPTIKMTTSSIAPTHQFTTTPTKQSTNTPSLPNNNSKLYHNVPTNSKSIYRGAYSNSNHNHINNHINNNSFSQSDIMSMMTRKSNYAIQSVPHSIVHAKLPSRDYFGGGAVDEIQEDVAEEDVGERKPNGFVSKSNFGNFSKNNFGNSNIYARQKTQLANVLATILSNKLKQHFISLKQSINISQTTRKTPTFNQNQSSSIRQSQTPASRIEPLLQLQSSNPEQQLIQRLVGKISRQSLNEKSRQTLLLSPKSKKSRTASKMLFSQYSENGQTHRVQTENLGYVPLVNKLVFVGGLELMEEHARVVNMNGQIGLKYSKKL